MTELFANKGEKYWMVHSSEKRAPKVKHETKDNAEAEAKRLAEQHIGEKFFVLETTAYYEVVVPEARRAIIF